MTYEWVNELGCSWENHIFGGQVTLHPSYADRETSKGNFMFASIQTWPNSQMGTLSGAKPQDAENLPRRIYPVPTLWISCLLHEEFWNQWIPRYGAAALKFPMVLYSNRGPLRDHSVRRLRVNYEFRELRPALRDAVAAFDARRRQWSARRPWINKNDSYWAVSPWADVHFRTLVERFKDASLARDEVTAQQVYTELFTAALSKGHEVRNWFWLGVSRLMYLCLPSRSTEQAVVQSRPQPSRWRRSWAAQNGGIAWQFEPLACNVETKTYALPQRHQPSVDGDRRHHHLKIKKYLVEKEREHPINSDLTDEFWQLWAEIGRKLRSLDLQEGEWIDFNFDMPPYGGFLMEIGVPGAQYHLNRFEKWNVEPELDLLNLDLSSVGTRSLRGDPFDDFDSDEDDPGVRPGGAATPAVSQFGKLWQTSARTSPIRYCTVGEVGDHRSQGDLWLLCDDGASGFDIYDVTGKWTFFFPRGRTRIESEALVLTTWSGVWEVMVKEKPAFIRATTCERTSFGWVMNNSDLIARAKGEERLVGKLMRQWLTPQEVGEMDGENGKPLWILLGKRVFDVTGKYLFHPLRRGDTSLTWPQDFPYESPLERSYLKFLGNSPSPGSPNSYKEYRTQLGDRVAAIHRDLEKYRCGSIRESTPKSQKERAFTVNEVGWHNNIENRMYTIIQDNVYDLTGESYPTHLCIYPLHQLTYTLRR